MSRTDSHQFIQMKLLKKAIKITLKIIQKHRYMYNVQHNTVLKHVATSDVIMAELNNISFEAHPLNQ